MSRIASRHRADGVSLIELMIALAIGTLLLIGLVQVFSASRTAYQLSTGLARVQENGRFAMDILQRDLRMAGHVGCVNDQARFLPENVTVSRPALASTFLTDLQQQAGNYSGLAVGKVALRFDKGIEGYDAKIGGAGGATGSGAAITLSTDPALATVAGAWDPAIPQPIFDAMNSGTVGNPVANSDVVVLRYFNPVGAQMTAFTPGTPAILTFSNGARLSESAPTPSTLFGISDCLNSAVFQASDINLATGSMKVPLSGLNQSGLLGNQSFVPGQASIYRAESMVYYIGKNAQKNPALFRVRFNANEGGGAVVALPKEEMVEGIETMQLQYGQDSRTAANTRPTGNISTSVLANAVQPGGDLDTAWRRVGMVQVGLVSRSPDTAAAQQRGGDSTGLGALTALGVTVTPPAVNDGRYRTVYEDSIAFRNRLFGN